MRYLRYTLIVLLLSTKLALAQSDGISPQLWNNFGFGWQINNSWSQYNEGAINFLADSEFSWREVSYFGSVDYVIFPFLEAVSGIYLASTVQDLVFRTNEVRPFLGIRVHSSVIKRASIANLSRFEWRNMHSTVNGWQSSFRFRNRTTVALALNKPSLADIKMLSVFGFFELFSNSERVEERFFKTLKYKFGLAYRISNSWRFNIGAVFQQSENTINQPSQLPSEVLTNVIVESGVSYRLIRE